MIILPKKEAPTRDHSEMTNEEMESEWHQAKESFDQALAQKTETDRIYVGAATRLNAIERLIKKAEQRAAVAKRAIARSLFRGA